MAYWVRSTIGREEARDLLRKLATADDPFRDELEQDPYGVLETHGIHLTEGSLKEPFKLPPAEKIADFLDPADAVHEETASPFGLALLFIVFGAMPMVTSGRPAGDGTG